MTCCTFASVLDADWLEASVEGGGVDDVGVKVAVVLPVDEERHDHRDNQAHDHRYDDAHVQSDVICTGSHWERKWRREEVWKRRKVAFKKLVSNQSVISTQKQTGQH